MSIIIGAYTFRTQGDARRHVSEILKRLGQGTVIREDHPEFEWFRALFDRHPERDQKYGAGLAYFRVDFDRALTVRIGRADGTEIDASFYTAIRGDRRMSPAQLLRAAMRQAVADQLATVRSSWKRGDRCGLCSRELTETDALHVDHEVQFEELVVRFLDEKPQCPTVFDDGALNAARFRAADQEYATAWSCFHRDRAILRLVHADCNLRRPRS